MDVKSRHCVGKPVDKTGMPFFDLLVLYIEPFSIFEDASTGTKEERWAKYRRNREKRIYLMHYAKIWAFLSVFLLAIGLPLFEAGATDAYAKVAATILLIGFTCSFVVLLVVIVAYVLLGHEKY